MNSFLSSFSFKIPSNWAQARNLDEIIQIKIKTLEQTANLENELKEVSIYLTNQVFTLYKACDALQNAINIYVKAAE